MLGKNINQRLSELDKLINRAKELGTFETVKTFCHHEYYVIALPEITVVYIPDDVEVINECDYILEQDDIYPKFNNLTADLKVIGGKGLKNTSCMFEKCKASSLDMNEFDTSNVTDMSYMFAQCSVPQVDFSKFNTSKVTDMLFMFDACKIQHINLNSFDTTRVTDMSFMFNECEADTIDLSGFITSESTDLDSMFDDCNANVTATDQNILNQLRSK